MPRSKRNQRTVAREFCCRGLGLFEGKSVTLTARPADVGHGVVFVRTDLVGRPSVAVSMDNLHSGERRTRLVNGTAEVHTVEHFLAALLGLGVDNLLVELDGPEPPILDGSAAPFVELLTDAGFVEQDAPRPLMSLRSPVSVGADRSRLSLVPADGGLSLSYTLDYDRADVPRLCASMVLDPEVFAREIAPARTFLVHDEIQTFRSRGLGGGATAQSVLVLGTGGPSRDQWRFPDEPARHKILDLLGDLFVLQTDLVGQIDAVRSGHALNVLFAREISKHMSQKPAQDQPMMDIRQIMNVLPHRYPFLLVDRVLELEDGKRAVGIKNVTFNEHFFQGHFPGRPIMPGVLQIEAMAQLAGMLLMKKLKEENKLAVLLSIDGVKFRRQVVPGDTLRLEAVAVRVKTRTGQVNCTASVEGQIAAEAQIKFMLVDFNEQTNVTEES